MEQSNEQSSEEYNNSNITIKYPQIHSGASNTEVRFLSGAPDLLKEFTLGECEVATPPASGLPSECSKGAVVSRRPRRFFITDATVATLPSVQPFVAAFDDGECGGDRLLVMGSGEAYKTIDFALSIIKDALKAGFSRRDTFVGIGGGVICDLVSFAASLFKRGASVELVPTTLLSMVDAAIGGKTGCDFDTYKNMIGTFFPAEVLHVWPSFVQSLPDDQYRSGLAECLKTAMLYDRELYALFTEKADGIKCREQNIIDMMIRHCATAKGRVVESDFLEQGGRMLLNLGHTFGHAFETVAGLGIVPHGDAVAWGMGRAACLAHNAGLCPASYKTELLSLLESYGYDTNAVPKMSSGGFAERMLEAMHKDKKNIGDKVRVILQRGICDTIPVEVEDDAILAVLR